MSSRDRRIFEKNRFRKIKIFTHNNVNTVFLIHFYCESDDWIEISISKLFRIHRNKVWNQPIFFNFKNARRQDATRDISEHLYRHILLTVDFEHKSQVDLLINFLLKFILCHPLFFHYGELLFQWNRRCLSSLTPL